jgi:hypothetical protein
MSSTSISIKRQKIKELLNEQRDHKALEMIMYSPPGEFAELLSSSSDLLVEYNLTQAELQRLGTIADQFAQKLILFSEACFHHSTCLEDDPEKSIEHAEKKLSKVRKAMGYSYP